MTELKKFSIDVERIKNQIFSYDDDFLHRYTKIELTNLCNSINVIDSPEESYCVVLDQDEVLFHLQRLIHACDIYVEEFNGQYSEDPLLLNNIGLLKAYDKEISEEI